MKPPAFDYADPDTLDGALALLADHGDDAVIIAGGQSLIPLLNLRLARPELVIDLRHIDDLFEVSVDESCLRSGTMVRAADLEEHPSATTIPGLVPALSLIAHSQIRARTTIGGSVAHADPAAELPALLVALDGSVALKSSARGERTVEAADFFLGPLWTAREPDEILTSVTFPRHKGVVAIDEVAMRPGDFALVGVVTAYNVYAGMVADPRIVLFGVAGTPIRVTEAEAALVGAVPSTATFAAAAEKIREHLTPLGDAHASVEYRRNLAAVLVERSLVKNND
ncbi:MAG: xanthine dehydrogenase family protein subunit M [Acidimicrobiales bacterium]|nr:xanthine dehydrogenase family protein subunit M [Acidimicrobiales bacterium]